MAEGEDREDSEANPKEFVGDSEEIPSIESVQISAENEIDDFEEGESIFFFFLNITLSTK